MPCCVCQVRFHHSAAAPRADNVQSPSARAVRHDHLRRRHQQLFTGAVQRLGDQALLGRTRRCTGEVPCNDSALHRQVETHRPRARKSLSALGCKCMIRMRRAARSPKLRVCRGGGGKGSSSLSYSLSSLAIAAPADWHLRGTAVLPLYHCKYTERSDVSAIRNCRTLPAIAGSPTLQF